MRLRQFLVACALQSLVCGAPNFTRRAPGNAFAWGSEKIRGVNIGGWLVLEPWITPSVFESLDQSLGIVDEYTLTSKLPAQAPGILQQHWATFTSFQDFQRLATAGFNVVRIPIGYWAYDNSGSPYVSGADAYLRQAIGWARQTTPPLKVIVDLHGAPGSQNGYDNSGQKTSNPTWLMDGGWAGPTGMKTLEVLQKMADIYAAPTFADVVIGIELINEAQSWRAEWAQLAQFYREGFGRVRNVSPNTVVVISDAFADSSRWNGLLTPSENNAQNVAVDHHSYQIFSNEEVSMTLAQHLSTTCTSAHTYGGADKWTFVGEWTGALTDCAKYLNGYGIGARYDGSYPTRATSTFPGAGSCAGRNDLASWGQELRDDTRQYIEAQMDAFERNANGWIWWNFKTEGGVAPEWDVLALLDAGVFPQPLTDRKFKPACASYS